MAALKSWIKACRGEIESHPARSIVPRSWCQAMFPLVLVGEVHLVTRNEDYRQSVQAENHVGPAAFSFGFEASGHWSQSYNGGASWFIRVRAGSFGA